MSTTLSRAARNNNPLNLRPLPASAGTWPGQTAIDNATGGPFAIFGSVQSGWQAAAQNLIAYQAIHGINTITGIASRWLGSPGDQPTIYANTISTVSGIGVNTAINLSDSTTLDKIMSGMAKAESPEVWDEAPRMAGILAALGVAQSTGVDTPVDQTPPPTPTPTPTPTTPATPAPYYTQADINAAWVAQMDHSVNHLVELWADVKANVK